VHVGLRMTLCGTMPVSLGALDLCPSEMQAAHRESVLKSWIANIKKILAEDGRKPEDCEDEMVLDGGPISEGTVYRIEPPRNNLRTTGP
jgi:hypothetical protein